MRRFMNKYYWIVALIMIVVLLQGFYLISYIKQTTIEYDSPIKEQLDKGLLIKQDIETLEKQKDYDKDKVKELNNDSTLELFYKLIRK